MELHYKLFFDNNIITFEEALSLNYITITTNGIKVNNNIKICKSTELLDYNDNEIFENDILVDKNNNKYVVNYMTGTFFICEVNGDKGCIPLALSGLKIKNKIDSMQII
mgnify:CR=1 FL=1|jgi:hypothetical protein